MEQINKNNSPLSLEEETTLKNAMTFIQEEYNTKIEQYRKLKEELFRVKKLFQEGLKEFQNESKTTIEKEQEIECLLSKNSKIKKNQLLSLSQTINNKFYKHLIDISNNKQKEHILKNFFEFLFIIKDNKIDLREGENFTENYNQSIQELLTIIKSEIEVKNILSYSYEVFHDLENQKLEIIQNIFQKNLIEVNQNLNSQYPFDFLFDYLNNVFKIINTEKKVDDLKIALNKMIIQKNAKFVEVKNLEGIIKKSQRNIKIIVNYIRAIKNFYNRIKEYNNNCDIRELITDIEKFKKIEIDYEKINPNFDAMTSLSFATNYTLSEDSSIKSSVLELKNNKLNYDHNNKNGGNNIKINENIIEKKNNKIDSCEKKDNNQNKFKLVKIKKNTNKNTINKENLLNRFVNKSKVITNTNKPIKSFNNEKKSTSYIYNTTSESEHQKQNFTPSYKNLNKNRSYFKQLKGGNKKNNIKKKHIINNNSNIISNKSCHADSNYSKNNNNKIYKTKTNTQKRILDINNVIKNHQFNQNNKYNLSKKVVQLKNKEIEESMEMILPKESLINDIINDDLSNDMKDSICDEMINQNYGTANNNLYRSTTNDYIVKLGMRNNVLLSENVYKTQFKFTKRNGEHKNVNVEKPIDTSSCCVSCT